MNEIKKVAETMKQKIQKQQEETLFEEIIPMAQEAKPLPATIPTAEPVLPAPQTAQIQTAPAPVIPAQSRPQQMGDIIFHQILAQKTGSLSLTPQQEAILYAPFKDEEVLIRPDGLIYLSWSWYAERLRKAFGLGWQLVPDGDPKKDLINGHPTILWKFALFIQGVCVGVAYGEHQETRQMSMSYGDMTESAKSNALMRLCKGIGMSLKLWGREYAEAWKKAYATTYSENGKTYWRKLRPDELQLKKENFIKSVHALGVPKEQYYEVLKSFGYSHATEVQMIDYINVYKVLEAKRPRKDREEVKNEERNFDD